MQMFSLFFYRCSQRMASLFVVLLVLLAGPVYAQTCSIPGSVDPITLSVVPNSYFPGAATAAAGASSLTIGAINAAGATTAISPGDLLLVIQMQGAVINSTQTNQYGDGAGSGVIQDNTGDPARGSISNTAGTYEFAVATTGGPNVGLSAPLQNAYTNAAATATQGQQTFQVIRVPQYSSLTLAGTINVPQWNGTSGGVFVLDVAGVLNLGGAVINGNFRGFRGGGGLNQVAITPNLTDYRSTNASGGGAFKGEGIAGTPALVRDSVTGLNVGAALGADGYPNGDRSRGAPGNAGGGGTQHNAGGGGGGNGGIGGFGGNAWNGQVQDGNRVGGFGGANGYNSATRIIMGGGGGAGDQNNSAATLGAGGAGGAIAMIRAGTILGTGTINLNGAAGEASTGTDASGAGGAGGTAYITTGNTTLPAGLTINALGGAGANSGDMGAGGETDGPGGGGGGGVLVSNSTGGTFNAAGGTPGLMTNSTSATCGSASANPSCFATAGGAGVRTAPITTPVALTGVRPAAECLPDIRVTKATSTPLISVAGATTAVYTITVQNFGGGARHVSVIDNALPPGWTLASAPTYAYNLPLPVATNNLSSGAEASNTAGGATFPLQATPVTVPANGDNALTWRQFFLGPLKNNVPSSVTITMVVNIPATAPVGCYHNPAGITYLDPTRIAGAVTREITPATNNGANRAGALYSVNTTFASGSTTAVAGSNYSGLAGGPTTEDVCLQGDLSVTKTVSPAGAVAPGGTLTYTLSPRNNGRLIRDLTFAADQATDAANTNAGTRVLAGGSLQMVDTLPAGLAPTIGFFGTDWTCNQVGQVVTCNRAATAVVPLAAATTLTGVVGTVLVTQAACGGGPLVNNVSLTGFQAPYTDSLPANNTASVTSPAANCNANLQVTKTNGVSTVVTGSTTSYTLNFTNAGPSSADGAIIRDVPSAGLVCTVANCTPSGGAVCPAPLAGLLSSGGQTITPFPSGASLVYTINCQVTASGQ